MAQGYSKAIFPRSDGPLVSVSLPTRGRPHLLYDAVKSLNDLALIPDKIEYLFRADTDDPKTIDMCCRLVDMLPQATLVVEHRGLGYVNIHHWHGRLCALARGDWIMVFNDDATMLTPEWDAIIANLSLEYFPHEDIALSFFVSKNRPGCNEFFILRRKALEVLGFMSLSPHADNWLHRVFTQLNACGVLTNVVVDHFSGEMEDQTRIDSVKAYNNGALAQATLESLQARKGISDCVKKLSDYIQANKT